MAEIPPEQGRRAGPGPADSLRDTGDRPPADNAGGRGRRLDPSNAAEPGAAAHMSSAGSAGISPLPPEQREAPAASDTRPSDTRLPETRLPETRPPDASLPETSWSSTVPRGTHRRGRRFREPAYLRIADEISEQIGAGLYRAGDQLPTEPQLRAQAGVSPMTVRRAIGILLDRGLVTTTQGKGTFVRSLDMGEAIFRLQEMTGLWMDDTSVTVLLLEARIRPADEQVATMLDLAAGDPIVFLRRVIQRKTQPLIYQLEHIVYDEHRPLVEAELQVTSLEGLLRSPQAEGILGGRLTIQAVSLDTQAAAVLNVPDGSPAFCLESLFCDFDGRPVSWGRFLCRADQFRLTSYLGPTASKEEV